MADDEIQNQGVSTIKKMWKRFIDSGTGYNSRAAIGNRIKYMGCKWNSLVQECYCQE